MTDERAPRARRLRTGLIVLGLAALGVVVYAGIVLASDDAALRAGGEEGGGRPAAAAAPVAVDPEAAPDLTGQDPVSGETVALADFAGTPVVINIWASWCPGCNDEAADLREFAADHPEIVLLGVDFQDTVAGARDFYRRWDWSHPSIFDSSGSQTAALGLFGLPTTLFLDEEHRVAARVVGATDRAGFERGLQLALEAS